jgi:hypothetical protein
MTGDPPPPVSDIYPGHHGMQLPKTSYYDMDVCIRSTYVATLGDAVASFLQRPDPVAQSQRVLGKEEMLYKLSDQLYHNLEGEELYSQLLCVQGSWLPQRR